MDEQGRWAGGRTVAVQVGDQLDRGPDEVRILFLLERLKAEAARAGGEFIAMNGNHESMNAAGRFRYSTPAGVADFARWQRWQRLGAGLKGACGLPAGACAPAGKLPAKAPPHAPEAAARAAALCLGVRTFDGCASHAACVLRSDPFAHLPIAVPGVAPLLGGAADGGAGWQHGVCARRFAGGACSVGP